MKCLADLIETALAAALTKTRGPVHPERAEPPLGLRLGVEVGSDREVIVSEGERRRHMYLIGATGSGKTNLVLRLIEEELESGRTAVVLDLRGDLVDRIAGRGKAAGRTVSFDLREESPLGFNPLAGSGGAHSRAMGLLDAVRAQSESWGIQLDESLRNCLVALAFSGGALTDIEPLLDDEDFRAETLKRCHDESVLRFFDRYGAMSAERRRAWSLPVFNKITPLLCAPEIRAVLSQPDGLDWGELLDEPGQLVLVALAAHRFHAASRLLGGLMVASIERAVMARAETPEERRNPATLFVDEFETMAGPAFASLLAEGRRFGLSLALSHQNLSQMEGSLRQTIRNNAAVQLFFQTGATDAGELAQDVSGLGSRDRVKTILCTQKVGEAVLVRRGRPSLRVTTEYSPDPPRERSSEKQDAQPEPQQTAPTTYSREVRHDKPPIGLG